MAWIFFNTSDVAVEEMPIDAATMIDCVRNNCQALIDASAHSAEWPIVNTAYTTTSATYTNASCLWRSPPIWIPSADSLLVVRRYRFQIGAYVSSGAQTGTIRIWAGNRWAVPSNVAEADFATVETAGITVTALANFAALLNLQRVHTFDALDGLAAGEPADPYRATYFGIQGKVTGGATLTLERVGFEAVNP